MGMDALTPFNADSTKKLASSTKGDAVAKAAKEFETVFLSQAVNSMLKDVGGDGMFGGGAAEQQWRSFLGEAYAKAMSDSNTTGIAPSIEKMMRAYKGGMEK